MVVFTFQTPMDFMNTVPPIPDAPRASAWFYADSENTPQGPLPFANLQRLAAEGAITPETQVIAQGGQEWMPFARIIPPPLPAPPSPEMSPRPQETTPTQGYQVKGGQNAILSKIEYYSRFRWVVISALILFCPLGLVLLWRSSAFENRTKKIVTAIAGPLFLVRLFSQNPQGTALYFSLGLVLFVVWLGQRFASARKITTAICCLLGFIFLPFLSSKFASPEDRPSQVAVTSPAPAASQAPTPAVVRHTPAPIEDDELLRAINAGVSREEFAFAKRMSAALYSEMNSLLGEIEKNKERLLSGDHTYATFREVAQRHRIQADDIQKRVEEFDKKHDYSRSPFSSIGGAIGHPLAYSAVEVKMAAQYQATLFQFNGEVNQRSADGMTRSMGRAKQNLKELKTGLDGLNNPSQAKAEQSAKDTARANALARMKARTEGFPPPNPNATTQPVSIFNSTRSVRTDGKIVDQLFMTAPTTECMEEYVLATMNAAKTHAATKTVDQVECILLPSADSDSLFALAITRYTPAKSGEQAWEILASRVLYTKKEVAVTEAWKVARERSPSGMTDEIEAQVAKACTLLLEDVQAVPPPNLQRVSPIFK